MTTSSVEVTYNNLFTATPAEHVEVHTPEDVAAAVRRARRQGRGVAVQNTGHGLFESLEGAVLIDTSAMKGLHVDAAARTVRAEAGVRWGDVIQALVPLGLAPLNGSYPGVGVMGYTLGGGLGPMARAYGYAADHVLAIEAVLADSNIVTATADTEPELFWGMRGGKSSFGIATAITFRVMPVRRLYAGALYFDVDDAATLLDAYLGWTSAVSDQVTSSFALRRVRENPDLPDAVAGRWGVQIRVAHLGDEADAVRDAAPLRAAAPLIWDDLREIPYRDVARIHRDPAGPSVFDERSQLLSRPGAGSAAALLETWRAEQDNGVTMVELRHLGGAIRRGPEVPNAVSGRSAAFNLLVVSDGRASSLAASERIRAAVGDVATGQTFLNFLGTETLDNTAAGSYDEDAAVRLRALKRQLDPESVFRYGPVILPMEGRP